MKVVLFYQYYHNPDCAATCRHYTLLKHLARWHDLTVVTTDTWKERRLTHDFPWLPDGVKEISFHVPYSNNMGVMRRKVAFSQYMFRSLIRGADMWDADVVWGSSTPLTAAWVAERCARRIGVPWLFEVRDLWPDFPIQMGAIRNPLMIKALKRLEKSLYKNAEHIVALSPDMASHIRSKGASDHKITTMPNGTDFDLLDSIGCDDARALRSTNRIGDRNVVLYAGTLGRANAVPALMETARLLRDRPDLVFVVIGHGYYSDQFLELAKSQENLLVLPMQPRPTTLTWFKLASLSLVTFADIPVLSANSPAKLFDSLGAGTPVIVTNPGWMERFVSDTGTGWFVSPESPQLLSNRILSLFDQPEILKSAGLRAEEIARDRFDRVEQAAELDRIFRKIVSEGTGKTHFSV